MKDGRLECLGGTLLILGIIALITLPVTWCVLKYESYFLSQNNSGSVFWYWEGDQQMFIKCNHRLLRCSESAFPEGFLNSLIELDPLEMLF